MEEPEVVIVLKYNAKVDSTRLLANPVDFMITDKWSAIRDSMVLKQSWLSRMFGMRGVK